MKSFLMISTLIFCIVSPLISAEDSESETFTLSGKVFDQEGNLAGSTSIKVDSLASSWSDEEGNYVFSGITPGEHTVRAYFMNNGHSVSYRKIVIDSDVELDWQVGMNWVTTKIYDNQSELISNSPENTIQFIESDQIQVIENGRSEFGLIEIGTYITLKTTFGNIDDSTHYLHLPIQEGSSTYPAVNDYSIYHGHNSKYGFLKDDNGVGISGVTVNAGSKSSTTNEDGFFLINNLLIGTTQQFTFSQSGTQMLDPVDVFITDGPGWLNLSSNVVVEFPEIPFFLTQVQTVQFSELEIEWQGGNFTEYFSLYQDGILVYKGTQTSYIFDPQDSGSYEFKIESSNYNGSVMNNQSLLIIVLPESSDSDLWTAGMSWEYSTTYTPMSSYGIINVTMTVMGTENTVDAFGRERQSFLTRMSDEADVEGEKSYRWIDSENLFTLHTYWIDAPSESSYYMEGTLGWDFTDSLGQEANPLNHDGELNLHFNRTNVIGVPGHPDGNDDTQNIVTITKDVPVSTPAGNFSTTHIVISDSNDGIISWELWYNDTVKNWVKIIDRLPGTHSEMVVKELNSFDFPITPQFITESTDIDQDFYSIQWAEFEGAESYQLLEDNQIIYNGSGLEFNLSSKEDGTYRYRLNAILTSGTIVEGDTLKMNVLYILAPPEILTLTQTIEQDSNLLLSWIDYGDQIAWYSVTLVSPDGSINEIYNGTDNSTSLEDLQPGQNRLRVKQSLLNGKTSEFSSSVFINVEEVVIQESDDSIPSLSMTLSILVLILSAFVVAKRGR